MPTLAELEKDIAKQIVAIEEAQNTILDEWKSFSRRDKDKAGGVLTKIQKIKEGLIAIQIKIEKEKIQN